MGTKNIPVTHNPEEHRFELTLDGHLAVLDYITMDDIIVFTHTGVPPEIEGEMRALNWPKRAWNMPGRTGWGSGQNAGL